MNRPQRKRNNQLRKAREAVHLTQKDLADRIGASEKSVWRWEAGKATPHPNMQEVLCKELAKTQEELG